MKNNSKNLKSLIEYPKEGVVSKQIIDDGKIDITLFSMASDTKISDHTSTKTGFIYVIEGEGIFYLAGKEIKMQPGVYISMAANAVHSLEAKTDLSFVLSLF